MLGSIWKDKLILLAVPIAITLIVLGVLTTPVLSLISFLLSVILLFFLDNDQILCLLVGLMPFSNIFKADSDSISYLTLLEIVVVLLLIIRNKKISLKLYGAFVAFAFYLFLCLVCGLQSDVDDIVKLLVHLFLLYMFSRSITLEGIDKAIFLFTISLLAALLLSLNLDFYRSVEHYFANNDLHVDAMLGGINSLRRCSGLFNDPNYCSIAIIADISILMVHYYYKRSGIEFWIFIVALIPLGMLTYSKSYFLVLIVLLILFYLFVLIPRHRWMALLAAIVGVALLALALNGKFESVNIILDRFSVHGDVTTGRADLLKYYYDYLARNTSAFLFGEGLSAAPLFGINNVHNFIMDGIYKIGLLGMCATFAFVIGSIPAVKIKQIRPVNFIPSACVFVMYMFLAGIASFDFWYYFFWCMAAVKLSEANTAERVGFWGKLRHKILNSSLSLTVLKND